MKTNLKQIANFYNESDPLNVEELERMIEEAGAINDCGNEWGICHTDTAKVVINDRGEAEVIMEA